MSNPVWQYTEPGRLSTVIEYAEREIPTPGAGEVLVAVKATALNPVDEQLAQSSPRLLRFMGAALPSPATPCVPASDFSGIVVQLGAGVTEFAVGDEVFGQRFAMAGDGFAASLVVVAASAPFIKKPPGVSWTEGAAAPLVYTTVYDALVEWGRLPLQPAEGAKKRSVLVVGASGGTGSVAVQLAKKMGCNVVATCSGANVELVKSIGADEVINYVTDPVAQRALTSPYAPYAVVLDCVGGTSLIPHLEHLILDDPTSPELGIYVTIVGDKTSRDAMGGAVTNLYAPAQALRTIRGTLHDYIPSWLPGRSWVAGKRYACIRLIPTKEKLESYGWYKEHGGKILVDGVYPFDQAREAYARLESGRAKGKVVLEVDQAVPCEQCGACRMCTPATAEK